MDEGEIMKMGIHETTEADEGFRQELIAVIRKHGGDMAAERMLALASYMVGQIVAMQDQTRFTGEQAMEIVAINLELGNRHAVNESLGKPKGSA